MERVWDITSWGEGVETQQMLFTYSEEEQEENRIAKNNAGLILRPEYFTIDFQMLHVWFNWYECAIYSFIKFFLKNNSRFFCTNEQLAEMLGVGERSIITAMAHLQEAWLIKNHYKIKAWWWKIRFVELQKTTIPKSEICFSDEQIPLEINNKIINNKNNIDIYRAQEKISYIELDNTHVIPTSQPLDSLPSELVVFLRDSYQNYPSTRYQIDKQQGKYVDTMMKDYNYLCKEYGEDTVKTVLTYIKQDDFRKNQIQSISKLRKKNKDWIPYIVVMMEKIQQYKPNILDLDAIKWTN